MAVTIDETGAKDTRVILHILPRRRSRDHILNPAFGGGNQYAVRRCKSLARK